MELELIIRASERTLFKSLASRFSKPLQRFSTLFKDAIAIVILPAKIVLRDHIS